MERPSSTEPPDLWERDGSLRDVYVFSTSDADWLSLFEVARKHRATYFFDGTEQPLPQPVVIFSNKEGGHLLQIDLGKVQVNCHFFIPEEIELDIDPRQVTDESSHEMILGFLEELARKTSKPLVITPENAPETPCLSFEPTIGKWTVHPPIGGAT